MFKSRKAKAPATPAPEEVERAVEALGVMLDKAHAMRRAFEGVVPRREAHILSQVDARRVRP